ncbi:MAG: M28 family peptidase [Clostridia bacterium]|nr:M28 family peptidase [Clostridia bacterium]
MRSKQIEKIFRDTAYVRMGGSAEERQVAEYIKGVCAGFGREAYFEEFEVDMATVKSASLYIDGKSIPCHGYMNCGSGEVEAELYYLCEDDKRALSECRGKIVMIDGYLGYWKYQDMLDNGALGFITYDGNVNYADRNIDRRELRSYVSQGRKVLGVNINAKDAVAIINGDGKVAKIVIDQDEYKGKSQNVLLDLPGEIDEMITFTAHYDSTSLSQGAYDNMSGCVGLLSMAEYFSKKPHKRALRFIWCGSEERGLLGSKAYCEQHAEELEKVVLGINIDMIGCIMGKFCSICTAEQRLVNYLSYLGDEIGIPVSPAQEIHSSDSTPFADKGIPTASFVRRAPQNTATIHNSYDTRALIKTDNMQKDIAFITAFAERMANAVRCPVDRVIPDNMKEKLDKYLLRKR